MCIFLTRLKYIHGWDSDKRLLSYASVGLPEALLPAPHRLKITKRLCWPCRDWRFCTARQLFSPSAEGAEVTGALHWLHACRSALLVERHFSWLVFPSPSYVALAAWAVTEAASKHPAAHGGYNATLLPFSCLCCSCSSRRFHVVELDFI